MKAAAPLVALLATALPAMGGEIDTAGLLSDEALFRAVTCAAPPGADCAEVPLRWESLRPLRVGIARMDEGFLGRPKLRAAAALERAVQALNDAGAELRLVVVPAGARAEIELFFLDLTDGAEVSGTGITGLDGTTAEPVLTWLDAEGGRIGRAAVVVSRDLATADYEPRILAALAQTLGFPHTLRGDAYAGSVFATAPGVTRLAPQDIMALRRLYAPRNRP